MVNEIKTFETRKEEMLEEGKKKGYITFEELAEKLKGLDCDAETEIFTLRNASIMLKQIETYVNEMPNYEEDQMYIKRCLTDIIYPLGKAKKI